MRKIILGYNQNGKLYKTVSNFTYDDMIPSLYKIVLTEENGLKEIQLIVSNSNDMNECISLLRSKPVSINKPKMIQDNNILYVRVYDIDTTTLIEKVIEEIPSLYNHTI